MRKSGKYDTFGLIEDRFEPRSGKRVLKNLAGIKSKRQMDRAEASAYAQAFEKAVRIYGKRHRFSARDVRDLHKLWLGRIYPWAGVYRSVNISKGHFFFAAAGHIPSLMKDFEEKILDQCTPCLFADSATIAHALATVHVELVLIHPFREGNGRLARLLSVLMALQAGLPALDFKNIQGAKKDEYFSAVRAGLERNYVPMQGLFLEVIKRSLRTVSEKSS